MINRLADPMQRLTKGLRLVRLDRVVRIVSFFLLLGRFLAIVMMRPSLRQQLLCVRLGLMTMMKWGRWHSVPKAYIVIPNCQIQTKHVLQHNIPSKHLLHDTASNESRQWFEVTT